jgi:hypothetical protein
MVRCKWLWLQEQSKKAQKDHIFYSPNFLFSLPRVISECNSEKERKQKKGARGPGKQRKITFWVYDKARQESRVGTVYALLEFQRLNPLLRLLALGLQGVHGAVKFMLANNDSSCACSAEETDLDGVKGRIQIRLKTMRGWAGFPAGTVTFVRF